MNSYIEELRCWWRSKPPVSKELPIRVETPSPMEIKYTSIDCSQCFRQVKNDKDFVQKAQIGKNIFGFCTDECYLCWLKIPSQFGKIN
jgi:hypothetical protein